MTTNDTRSRPDPQAVRSFLLQWQKDLCAGLENLQQRLHPESPASPFRFDHWQRGKDAAPQPDTGAPQTALQGSGISAVAAGGALWEKAGVNFSHVRGASLPPAASARHPQLAGRTFEAMGVSIVIHPLNPYVPTTHANIRFLSTEGSAAAERTASAQAAAPTATHAQAGVTQAHGHNVTQARTHDVTQARTQAGIDHTHAPADAVSPSPDAQTLATHARSGGSSAPTGTAPLWWFGGGFDLTPYYGFREDAVHWHQVARDACAPFGTELYPKFKQACDRYFYLPHRDEARGVGGLFFDDTTCDGNFDTAFALSRSIAEGLFAAYAPIVERRAHMPYAERERNWQLYRRGRYVEFNLICDRGTHFGLQSRGRTESILMSLPPLVRWEYDYHPQPDSPEAELLEHFLPAQDWLAGS